MTGIIRQLLGLEIDWMMSFISPDQAINFFVEKLEDVGVCVFFNGIVGSYRSTIMSHIFPSLVFFFYNN